MNTSALSTILFLFLFATTNSYGQITADAEAVYTLDVAIAPVEVHNLPRVNARPNNRPISNMANQRFSFHNFFAEHVEYPTLATDNAMEGVVILRLWVASNGTVKVLGVDHSDYALLDDAVLKAAAHLPDLQPAIVDGQAVGKSVLVPVHFFME